ncbi:hypothetical protein OEA41_010364 [Lepraria neglecta]|uniref:Uncharacterized protein n=1 Tax=Lepraria neglecta TaxID=209136 RepID=A0AAD9YYX3_9LECA|nr:hypothetical protein OEA41_010364 [Lepraria neglecta]
MLPSPFIFITSTIPTVQDANFTLSNRGRQISYLVPNTQTRLEFFVGAPMDSKVLLPVFRNIRRGCEYMIYRYGDKQLPSELDPLTRIGPSGHGDLDIGSINDLHLTYKILEATMLGFIEVLITQECNCEARVEIFYANLGLVGMGSVTDKAGTSSTFSRRRLLRHPIIPRRDRQQDYLVPNTTTRLLITFGSPMDTVPLQRILQSVRAQCNYQIIREGDGPLPSHRDPFVVESSGADLVVSSIILEHLTYGILRNVMQGLLDVLVVGKVDCEAMFYVWENETLIADGIVGVKYLG